MFISWLTRIAVLIAFSAAFIGCSGSGGDIPTTPGSFTQEENSADIKNGMPNLPVTAPGHHLAGIFDLDINLASREIKAIPLRETAAHYDATDFLMPPSCYDCVSIEITDHYSEARVIKANVFIRNPSDFTVYDVRGILMTNQDGWKIVNGYGYTPLYDDGPPILYNPYREFYWGTESKPDFSFWPDSLRVQEYVIQYPEEPDFAGLKYVVDVSWPDLCPEPYRFEITGPGALIAQGGDYTLSAQTYDHEKDEISVTVDASAIGAGFISLERVDEYPSSIYWEGDFHFPGIDGGIAPGNYELTCYACSDGPVPAIQTLSIYVSPFEAPVEITPVWLNNAPRHIVSIDNIAIFGGDSSLSFVDFSDQSNPQIISRLDLAADMLYVNGLLVEGNTLIINGAIPGYGMPGGDDKFGVVDITDPWNPQLIRVCNLIDENHNEYIFHLADGYLYVHSYKDSDCPLFADSIWVFDVEPPSQAHLAYKTPFPEDSIPRTSHLLENKLYVRDNYQMLIYQVEPGIGLELKNSINFTWNASASGMISADGYAYMRGYGDDETFLYIFDIDPVESFSFVGKYDTGQSVRSLVMNNEYVYALNYYYEGPLGWIVPVDISNPESPIILPALEIPVPNAGMIVKGDKLHGSNSYYDDAIIIVDFAVPEFPVSYIWNSGYPQMVRDCTVIQDRVIFPVYNFGCFALDVANLDDMSIADEFFTISHPVAAAIRDNLCYVLDRSGWIKIIDISEPDSAHIIGVVPDGPPYENPGGSDCIELEIWGDYLIAIYRKFNVHGFFHIYDISDPYNPQYKTSVDGTFGRLDFEGNMGLSAYGILFAFVIHPPYEIEYLPPTKKEFADGKLRNGYAYAVINNETHDSDDPVHPEFRVIDPSIEGVGRLKLKIGMPGLVRGIALSGDYAYITDSITGIDILKIEPWEESHIIDTYTLATVPGWIMSHGSILIAYGGNGYEPDSGWELLYRDSNGSIHPVGTYMMPYSLLYDAKIAGDCIYICDYRSGLHIYQAW